MSDNVVPANVDTCLVEFNKKEYAIVGDVLFANTVEEVPQWFQNLIQDKVLQVNGPMYDMLTQYNLSLLAALQGLDIAKNTYEQYIYKVLTDNEAYVASLTTLNSSIAGNDASIRQLLSTYATQDYAVATAAQLLTASLNGGAIGASIGSVETAMATQYGAMAQRLQTLESSFDDVSGQQGANASAIQALTTYTGYGVYNGADALIANSNFYSNLNAYLDGTDYDIGGSSTLIQDVTAVSTEKMKLVEAKFEYGSTIEIDGKQYNAGFGLVQTGTLLPDGTTYDSEFWIRASKFKFVADDGVTVSTPFQISDNTVYIGWDAITGSNKPEEGATRNVVTGTWSSSVMYYVGDMVQYSGSSYSCIVSNVGQTPFEGSSYWFVMAKAGVNGTRTANLIMYKWSNTLPTSFPSGTSTYTWSTSQFTAPVTANGWSTTIPAPINGYTLYACYQPYSDLLTTPSSTVTWSANTSYPLSYAGINGTDGSRGTSIGYGTSATNSAFSRSTGLSPIYGDQLVVTNSSGTIIYTYNGSSWSNSTVLQISGDAVIDGTLAVGALASSGTKNTTYGTFALGSTVSTFGKTFACAVGGVNGTHGVIGSGSSSGGAFGNTSSGAYGDIGTPTYGGLFSKGTGTYSIVLVGPTSPFTGAHDALINSIDNVVPGDILADVRKVRGPTLEDAITEVRVSSTANDKAVVGVFYAVPNEEYTPIALVGADDSGLIAISMLSLGEGHVNVCGLGGNLEPGDLITSSSIPGKGMKQADDVVRNYTFGKCREHVTFDYPEQVKQVACIYMCG